LDTASRLLIVRRQGGREVERKDFLLGVLTTEALARSLVELRVDVLLCAALSRSLRLALERRGLRVEPHLCGEVEALLRAFCAGRCRRSEFRMPGCWDRHDPEIRPRRNCSARLSHPSQAA
jgi:hypothetical protein